MREQHLNNRKKLNKKELKSILGGKPRCFVAGVCIRIADDCAEPQCNIIHDPA